VRLPGIAVAVALALLALFATLNWPAFTAPTALTLGFADVSAPLGVVMLIVTGVVSGLFLLYILFLQARVILEARRTAKELQGHRELADKAEASRFTELRTYLETELRTIEAQNRAADREIGARIDRLESALRDRATESDRTVSAHLGEIEDKLDHVLPPPRA
jgi:uncharacterized integral membrane protein